MGCRVTHGLDTVANRGVLFPPRGAPPTRPCSTRRSPIMSHETDSTAGFHSEIFKLFLRIFLMKPGASASDACYAWNKYANEAPVWVAKYDGPTKKKQAAKATALQRVFKEVLRTTPHFDLIEFLPSGEARLKGDTTLPSMIEAVEPTPEPVITPPEALGRPFTPMEEKLAKLGKPSRPILTVVPSIHDDLDEMTRDLVAAAGQTDPNVEKMKALAELTEERRQAVMKMAEGKVEDLAVQMGEDLWKEGVTIGNWPKLKHKAIFFCSSTAKFMGTGVPIKHDFRANDEPVTHKHPLAYKEDQRQKVIRSVTHQRGAHEYYCKALEYQDGMVIKGYFVVDGKEDASIMAPRYYRIHKEQVIPISELAYNAWLNRRSAR